MNKSFDLRKTFSMYLDKLYKPNVAIFLKLLLLNIKTYNHNLINQINNLNIIHLFVVSGLHISIVSKILTLIFKKIKYLNLIVNEIVILFLFYLSGFSISILRVLIAFNFKFFLKNNDSFKANLLSGIFINCFFVNEVSNFGYLMSIIASLYITYLIKFFKSKWICFLVINITVPIVILPIINIFNDQINWLSFVNVMLLSNIIIFIYFFSLIFAWMPFMVNVESWLIGFIINLFDKLSIVQNIIHFKFINCLKYIWYFLMIDIYFYIEFKTNQLEFNKLILKHFYKQNKINSINQ